MSRLRRMSLLSIKNLKMHFPVRGGVLMRSVASCKAVDGISLDVDKGETVGLVGESGCGKTTLGKAIVRLLKPTEGSLIFDGQDITHASMGALRPMRRHLQMIFQDPAESLNPRHTVRDILAEGVPAASHFSCIGATRATVREQLATLKAMGVKRLVALRGELNSPAASASASASPAPLR